MHNQTLKLHLVFSSILTFNKLLNPTEFLILFLSFLEMYLRAYTRPAVHHPCYGQCLCESNVFRFVGEIVNECTLQEADVIIGTYPRLDQDMMWP